MVDCRHVAEMKYERWLEGRGGGRGRGLYNVLISVLYLSV